MAEAEKALIDLKGEDDDKAKKAEIYVKIMRKVSSEGQAFATSEIERIKKILEGKLSQRSNRWSYESTFSNRLLYKNKNKRLEKPRKKSFKNSRE